MTTPLFLLRCVQLGISIQDLELLSIGLINEMYIESRNDEWRYCELGTQEDIGSILKRFRLRIQPFSAIVRGRLWLF